VKAFLQKFIICPVDRQQLSLNVFREDSTNLTAEQKNQLILAGLDPKEFESEIIYGVLINERKKIFYPIYGGVPRLIIFGHPLLDVFKQEFSRECGELFNAGYGFACDNSIPGEKSVLASFSKEWTDYGFNEDAYWGQTAEVYNSSLFETLQHSDHPLGNKLVMEVGIGSGGSAFDMSHRFGCSLIGVDLGYSVDVAYKHFGASPFLHIVQASVFNLPFREQLFDFVYSHGVIHHTFNTRKALEGLSRFPRIGGRLYIWVYSYLNEQRSVKRKLIMILERLIRPWCSRLPGWMQTIVLLPIAPLYIFHQNTQTGQRGSAKYSWREAMHAARDRFTPLYIHRHSEAEVETWFGELGFNGIRSLSKKNLPEFVPVGFYMNTGVEGLRIN